MPEIISLSSQEAQRTHAERRARRREVVTLARRYQALFGEVCNTTVPFELEPHQVFRRIQGRRGNKLLNTLNEAISGLHKAKEIKNRGIKSGA